MLGSVSLLTIQLCLFAFLAVKCAAIYAALRRESALAWLTGALLFAVIQTLAATYFTTGNKALLAQILFMPAAFYCVSKTVGLLVAHRSAHRPLWISVAGLSAGALVALLGGAPIQVVEILAQLAIALAIGDNLYRLSRAAEHHLLDWPLMAAFGALVLLAALRLFVGLNPTPAADSAQSTEDLLYIGAMLISGLIVLLLIGRGVSQLIQDLQHRTRHDGLTGLLNREGFNLALRHEPRQSGALLLADIDHFKTINDRYGHARGDAVIRAFADLLRDTGAVSARLGGEEFAVWLPDQDASGAETLANSIRRQFNARRQAGFQDDHYISASFGLSMVDPSEELAAAFQRADRALYEAKAQGRNKVALCPIAQRSLAAA